MLDWALIVICVVLLGLVGCKGIDRLTGTERPEKETPQQSVTIAKTTISPIHLEFAGVFTNDNFVEMKGIPYEWNKTSLDVIIIRKGKKLTVNSYTKKADEAGHPYYIVSGSGGLSFFNHQYGDEYQIFVLK